MQKSEVIMNVKLSKTPGELNFLGINEKGHHQSFSGSGTHCSPMESLLLSAAACSAIDVEIQLKKMRQELTDLQLEISSKRRKEISPAKFTSISILYILHGNIKPSKAEEAIRISLEKMCSVSHSLDPEITINSHFKIIP